MSINYQGLSPAEVLQSRNKSGANILRERHRKYLHIFFEVVKEPMLILLVLACGIYFIMGEAQEGILMMIALVAVSAISVFQQIRSEHALKALKKLSQPLSFVIRDGIKISIASEELVVGDILIVSEGQQVVADAVILD